MMYYEIFAYSVLAIIAIAMIIVIIIDSDNTVKDFVEMVREVRTERKKNTREKKWGVSRRVAERIQRSYL